jgi:hypothetical protein
MTAFENRLWSDLVRQHGEGTTLYKLPESTRHRHRRALLGAAAFALVAVLGTVGALTLDGITGRPAYAVNQNPDGTVTVMINELTGVTGANAQLASLGVRAEAIALDPSCTSAVSSVSDPELLGAILAPSDLNVGVTIHPSGIPVGDTLLLAAKQGSSGQVAVRVMLVRDPAPSCVGGFRAGPTG